MAKCGRRVPSPNRSNRDERCAFRDSPSDSNSLINITNESVSPTTYPTVGRSFFCYPRQSIGLVLDQKRSRQEHDVNIFIIKIVLFLVGNFLYLRRFFLFPAIF